MAFKSVDHLISPTPTGAKVDLRALYIYPDGHANLVFADGTNQPLADQYDVVRYLTGHLLRPMEKMAKRKKPDLATAA